MDRIFGRESNKEQTPKERARAMARDLKEDLEEGIKIFKLKSDYLRWIVRTSEKGVDPYPEGTTEEDAFVVIELAIQKQHPLLSLAKQQIRNAIYGATNTHKPDRIINKKDSFESVGEVGSTYKNGELWQVYVFLKK